MCWYATRNNFPLFGFGSRKAEGENGSGCMFDDKRLSIFWCFSSNGWRILERRTITLPQTAISVQIPLPRKVCSTLSIQCQFSIASIICYQRLFCERQKNNKTSNLWYCDSHTYLYMCGPGPAIRCCCYCCCYWTEPKMLDFLERSHKEEKHWSDGVGKLFRLCFVCWIEPTGGDWMTRW